MEKDRNKMGGKKEGRERMKERRDQERKWR
jgi:hypothetical protein